MKRLALVLLATILIAAGCDKEQEGLRITDADETFREGSGDGYRVPIKRPMTATLTVSRTGRDDVVLTQDYRAGDEALFGHSVVSFTTKAGVQEHKFRAQLRQSHETIRDTGKGVSRTSDSTGKDHAFFLDRCPSGASGTMRNPLAVGQTLTFTTLRLDDGGQISLSIRFDDLKPISPLPDTATPKHVPTTPSLTPRTSASADPAGAAAAAEPPASR